MPSTLITGAATGIGEACALDLDRLGHRIFAGVRKAEDGERLRAKCSDRLTWLILDVTKPDQVAAAAKSVDDAVGEAGLDGLVNNAGIAVGGPLEYVSIDQVRHQFEVNVFGLLAVTQAFLPAIRRATGRIVNIGSIAGQATTPMVGPYCASKHAVESFTDGLRLELIDAGIRVSVIEPGVVQTPIWDKGVDQLGRVGENLPAAALERYAAKLKLFTHLLEANRHGGVSPAVVAAAVRHALTAPSPKTRYLIGRDARIRSLIGRYLPDRVADRFILGFLKRMERQYQ
jgi:NAD(P)-dependent dehydrogenase (short-subunit alcohol dehydrogenase family)